MPSPATAVFPRPKSWEEFQIICVDVMRRAWNDPGANEYGRQGQRQEGIDILGQLRMSDGTRTLVGAQCKNREKLDMTELARDQKLAKAFTPNLHEYWILTSSARDARVQKAVEGLQAVLPTRIWFWEDICQELAKDPELLAKHFPGWPGLPPLNSWEPHPVPSEVLLIHSGEGLRGARDLLDRLFAWSGERGLDISAGTLPLHEFGQLRVRARPQRLLVPVIAGNQDMGAGALVDRVFDFASGDMRTAVALAYVGQVGGDIEVLCGAVWPGDWPCIARPTATNLGILEEWALDVGGPLGAADVRLVTNNELWRPGVPIERDMRPMNAPSGILPKYVISRDCLDENDELVLEVIIKNRWNSECIIAGVGGEFRSGFWQKYSYGQMEPYVLKSIAAIVVDVKQLTNSIDIRRPLFGKRRLTRKLFVRQLDDSIVVPSEGVARITMKYINTSVLGDVFVFEPVIDSNLGLHRLGAVLCHAGTALMG